jgi:hypothetical protein
MMHRTAGTLFPIPFLALLAAGGGCRREGEAGAAQAAPATATGAPAVLRAAIRLPDPGAPRRLDATVTTGPEGWFMAGCVSPAAGECDSNPRFLLGEQERAAYAAHVAAIWAMPRCEPVGFAPDDCPFDLDLDGETRSGHIPRAWFEEDDEPGPPRDGSDPCMAEVYLAWWVYSTLAAHGRTGPDGPPSEPLPRCSEGCCGPGESMPDPSGHIECCFCGPL